MCRSNREPGGPRRCPSHGRARFADALAEVRFLELRELELYREASKCVADLAAPAQQAQAWYRQAVQEVNHLRDDAAERDIDTHHYRQAYREMRAAQRAAAQTRDREQEARNTLDERRAAATCLLSAAGLDAQPVLDSIDIETTLAPPFS